jgi:hypothetical protein
MEEAEDGRRGKGTTRQEEGIEEGISWVWMFGRLHVDLPVSLPSSSQRAGHEPESP